MGIKLVIVDDAPFIREVVKQIAEGAGIEVVGEATNGQEALEVVQKWDPDVVLMDVVMPEKNGIEAAKELLELNPQLAIVACSTLDNELLMIQALEAGCVDFVSKPFESEDIIQSIKNAVQRENHFSDNLELE